MANVEPGEVRIRRGDANGPLCNMFRDELVNAVIMHPKFKDRKDQQSSTPKNLSRPADLPDGSIFFYAERGSEDDPAVMGSISLIILHASSPLYSGLPADLNQVGEVKRTIVLDGFRGQKVASKLLAALEDAARNELGLKYLAVETWWELHGGMALYERSGYERRGPWGTYDDYDSVCYAKWL